MYVCAGEEEVCVLLALLTITRPLLIDLVFGNVFVGAKQRCTEAPLACDDEYHCKKINDICNCRER